MDINHCYNCKMKVSVGEDWHWCNSQRKHTDEVKKCSKVINESRYKNKDP